MTFLLLHLPDFLCLSRAALGIAVVVLGINPLCPILYSIGLITDLLDGYIFRHYVKNHPAWHRWNPLPITLDPLCDLIFSICGVMYVYRFSWGLNWIFTSIGGATVLAIGVVLNLIPELSKTRSEELYTVCISTVTGIFCLIPLICTAYIWKVNFPPVIWLCGTILSYSSFYYLFFYLDKTNPRPFFPVRYPPSNWRKDG